MFLSLETKSQTSRDAKIMYGRVSTAKDDTSKLELLIKLAKYQINKEGEYKTNQDSATALLNVAEKINQKLKNSKYEGCIDLTRARLMDMDDEHLPEAGKTYARAAIQIFNKIGHVDNLLGAAYYQLAILFNPEFPDSVLQRMNYLRQSLFYYRRSGDLEKQADCHKGLGEMLIVNNKIADAKIELNEAISIYKRISKGDIAQVYNFLGTIEYNAANYQNVLNYELTALKLARQPFPATLMFTYDRLCITYAGLFDYKKSIFYCTIALAMAEKLGDATDIIRLAYDKNKLLILTNKYQEALRFTKIISTKYPNGPKPLDKAFIYEMFVDDYTYLKDFKPGRLNLDKLLALVNKEEKTMGTYKESATRLAIKFYTASGQFKLAAAYLNLYIKLEKVPENRTLSNYYRMGYKLDSTERNYKKALDSHIKFGEVSNALLDEKKQREISKLEVEYETGKKELTIKLKDRDIKVLKQREQLQQSGLKQAVFLKNALFGGTFFLLIILALLFYQNKIKQHSNKTITLKNNAMHQLLIEKDSLLKDRELLLKEVHHRVKNNLHMISSLLESQSAFLEKEALLAIQNSQHRIQAISLIHQKLYVNENVTHVSMEVYLREIISYLKESITINEKIVFSLNIAPIELDVSQAVPLGLIVNEALTNAIKYAFPNDQNGLIEVSLTTEPEGLITLTITDNGIGFESSKNDLLPVRSLGMSLIKGLSKSLHGELLIFAEIGTRINLIFMAHKVHKSFFE
jgi:two-component sensor histidine kinase